YVKVSQRFYNLSKIDKINEKVSVC
ncbi:hypothetical protein D046_0139B, partial [Vibrio parahaemolyticus V-223/04]